MSEPTKQPWVRVRLAGLRKLTGPERPVATRWRWDDDGVTSPAGVVYETRIHAGLWLRRVSGKERCE